MASKNYYFNIIYRIILLLSSSLLFSFLIFSKQNYLLSIFIFLILVGQIIELINFLNRTNKKIAWFFDAVRNEDSTLNFPVNTGNKILNELNDSLNSVNGLIKNIKFDLQEQEQYFKTILKNVSVGIITHNKKGNIYIANPAAKKIIGHEYLTHLNQIAAIDYQLFKAIKDIEPGDRRLVNFNNRKGVVQISLKATHLKTTKEDYHLITIQDIKNELDAKELESWIKLIRVLTHEIMNSVAPITSLSQTILGFYKKLNGSLPDKKIINNTIKGLDVINERGAGLISFVETYRKLTRIPKPDKKVIPVKQFLNNIITLININFSENNINIKKKIIPNDMEIMADKKQISQVLINLIKNSEEALKNTNNGKILLKGQINEEGRAQITVIDNGIGIPKELMDKIFVPFFTTKDSGSGIGLSLSRQIMLLHGGNLKISSTIGGLTSVSLIF